MHFSFHFISSRWFSFQFEMKATKTMIATTSNKKRTWTMKVEFLSIRGNSWIFVDENFNFPCFKFNFWPSRAYHQWFIAIILCSTCAKVSNFNCRTNNSTRIESMSQYILNVHLSKAAWVNKLSFFMCDNVEKSLVSLIKFHCRSHIPSWLFFVSTKSEAERTSYRSFTTASTTAIKASLFTL